MTIKKEKRLPPPKLIPDLQWMDSDGDCVLFTTDQDEIEDSEILAIIELCQHQGEQDRMAVYMTPQQGRTLWRWLDDALDMHRLRNGDSEE